MAQRQADPHKIEELHGMDARKAFEKTGAYYGVSEDHISYRVDRYDNGRFIRVMSRPATLRGARASATRRNRAVVHGF